MGNWIRHPVEKRREYNHEEVSMKTTLNIIGILLFLAGLVFFLQGINILPGSFMTGDSQWAINGGIMMIIGAVMFFFSKRNG